MTGFTQAPKGTKDILPPEAAKWQYVEEILKKTAKEFGFSEIRFPTIEHTELFIRGVGDTTDVVTKEMYSFEDKGGRAISLRPEGTASVVRSFVEHGLATQGLPFKCYYIAPNFRYEKPQAGRLREHHQFGVEYFGSSCPSSDAEVIGLADTFLKRLGISDITVHINSIGCPVCRKDYYVKLKAYFNEHRDELCETCLSRLEKNPLRILDCKSPICGKIAGGAPAALDHLCGECADHFNKVKGYLDAMGIRYEIDTHIVRGLDYYTKTVFEFVSNDIGAQSTVCGGGRYDGLVESLGGPPTPGLGFGSGLERLLMVMESLGVAFPPADRNEIFIACAGEEADSTAQTLVHALRTKGIYAERDTLARSLRAQMKYADKIGSAHVLVLGLDELQSRVCAVKDMDTGEKTDIPLDAEAISNYILSKRECCK